MVILRDLSLAARQLRFSPGYSVAAILTLALAIGASTAIFSAVYAVLLKPMSIRDPQNVVIGWGTSAQLNMRVIELSYLNIADIARATPDVGQVAAVGSSTWTDVLDGEGDPVKLPAFGVSGTFFEVLGASPQFGRSLGPEDDLPSSRRVAVISHALWARQFGSDPNIIGRTIRLDGEPHDVVGVMPASFDYPQGAAIWKAVAPVIGAGGSNANALRNVGVLFMVGRLRPGVTPDAARDAWTRANAQVLSTSAGPKYEIAVQPFLDYHIGPARSAMWVLFGAVGVLLMIACANVSGLMLTRVSLRAHDDAVRVAIGGTRLDVARLWAAETVWLTVLGATAGLLVCQWLIGVIVALAPEGIPRLGEVHINVPVAAFSAGIVALVYFLCGALPIRHASIVNPRDTLNDSSRSVAGSRSSRVRSSLLVLQIALAVVLLVTAGLIVRSFTSLQALDLGFDREAVLRLKVEPRDQSQPVNTWMAQFLPQIATLPEVDAVGGVYLTPMELGSIGQGTWTIAEGQYDTPETANRNPTLNYQSATADYFRAMRIPLRRGRLFDDNDRDSSPRVAVISESVAQTFFPGQDPIGRRIKAATFNVADRNPLGAWRTIVGVVGNVRYKGLHEVPLDLYDPPAQTTVATITNVVVRLKPGQEGHAIAVASAISTQARQLDSRVLISGISMLEDVVNTQIAPWRFSAWVFSLFAALAFGLSAIGLFSVVSLDVANRQHEIAVRLALGATGGQIARGVFRTAALRSAVGVAAGLTIAWVASRALQDLLVGVTRSDPMTYALVATLVVAVVGLAVFIPARRAARIDPLALLRR